MLIAILNKSTRVDDADTLTMTRACAYQLRYHAAPAWDIHSQPIVFFKDESLIPPGSRKVILFDNADQQGALGYHDEGPDGQSYAKVFAATTLDNGGQVLSGSLSVSSVMSHEVLEMFVDPHCNVWWDTYKGKIVAAEVGDPVESDSYLVRVAGADIMVSNFVLPAWSDPQSPSGTKVDWLGKAPGPFQMTKGGYLIVAQEGKVSQVFGEEYPEWKKESKQVPAARTYRRLASPLNVE